MSSNYFTENIAPILSGIVATLTIIISILKIKKFTTNNTGTSKAVNSGNQIYHILDELDELTEDGVSATIIQTTNGGNAIRKGSPLYYKVIYSSDKETEKVFGDAPHRMGKLYLNIYGKLLNQKGELVTFNPQDFSKGSVEYDWAQSKEIHSSTLYLLGIERSWFFPKKEKGLVVAFNKKSEADLTPEESMRFRNLTVDLRKCFNNDLIYNK